MLFEWDFLILHYDASVSWFTYILILVVWPWSIVSVAEEFGIQDFYPVFNTSWRRIVTQFSIQAGTEHICCFLSSGGFQGVGFLGFLPSALKMYAKVIPKVKFSSYLGISNPFVSLELSFHYSVYWHWLFQMPVKNHNPRKCEDLQTQIFDPQHSLYFCCYMVILSRSFQTPADVIAARQSIKIKEEAKDNEETQVKVFSQPFFFFFFLEQKLNKRFLRIGLNKNLFKTKIIKTQWMVMGSSTSLQLTQLQVLSS